MLATTMIDHLQEDVNAQAGADAYLQAMWEEAQEAGHAVNWSEIDPYAEGGWMDEPGYAEAREHPR